MSVLAVAFYRLAGYAWFRDLTHISAKQSVTALVILAVSIATAVILFRNGRLRWMLSRLPAVFYLPYALTVLLAVPGAFDKGLAVEGAGVALAQVLLLFGALSLPAREDAICRVLLVLLMVGLIIAATTIVLFVASLASPAVPCGNAMCMGPFGFRPIFALGHWYPQATIPGIDKNTVGLQLALMTLCALYFARTHARLQFAWVGAALLLLIGVVVTFSKGALASFAVGVVVLIIRRWYRPKQVIGVLGLVAVLLAVSGLLGALLVRLLTVFQFLPGVTGLLTATNSRDTSDRFATVPSTIAFFLKNPITGIGPDNLDQYQVPLVGGGEHDFFLRTLAETGVVGEAGLLVILGGLVFIAVRAVIRSSRSPLGDVLAAGLAVYVANLLVATVDYSFFVWTGLLLCWALPRAHLNWWPRRISDRPSVAERSHREEPLLMFSRDSAQH